jgi:asparagine synthase (glutamine-hydrolysing)
LKALLVHPKLKREIDPLAVEDYFAYGVPEPHDIQRRIQTRAGLYVDLKGTTGRATG